MAKKKSKAHPWFANVAKSIANKQGISIDRASAILASWATYRTELLYRAISKFWFSEPITNSVAIAQIAYTFT